MCSAPSTPLQFFDTLNLFYAMHSPGPTESLTELSVLSLIARQGLTKYFTRSDCAHEISLLGTGIVGFSYFLLNNLTTLLQMHC